MTTATNQIGRIGEQMAVRFLEKLSYEIVDRNWRTQVDDVRGEVDVLARDGDTLVFCEVKTRRNCEDGDDALIAVTPNKQRQLRALAAAYLAEQPESKPVRFDVVAVAWPPSGGRARVIHVPGAF